MPATLQDIAKKTQTSVSTVSRVLAGGDVALRISPQTREKISAAAVEMGYRPNLLARSLRTRRSNTIGLLVSDIANPFFSSIAALVEKRLYSEGYSLMLASSEEDSNHEARQLRALTQRAIDGIILVPMVSTLEALRERCAAALPMVILDRPIAGATGVGSDNAQAAQLLCAALKQAGVRRVSIVSGPEYAVVHTDRARLIASQFEVISNVYRPAEAQGGRETIPQALAGNPDAIICTNATRAIGTLSAMNPLNGSPRPIVASFDQIDLLELLPVPVVCAAQDLNGLAETCVKQLLAQITQSAPVKETILLPMRLMHNRAFAWLIQTN